jgi:hypothetical protein
MAEARETFAAAMLPDGRVLLTGGKNAGTVSSTEIYDPVRNTVTSAGALTTGRWRHTATLLRDGRVLVAGGATTGDVPVASVELYDPATGLWSAGPPLATARQLHRATVLPDGRVLISGGLNGAGTALMSAELFDPGSNGWSSAGSMVYARQVHAAALLPSGKVLVAGGSTTSSSTATCELYDPALNSWTLTGSLNVGRYEHVAVLMASGKVLTAGGYSTGSLYLSSAEIYDPSTGVWTTTGSLTTTRMLFAGVLLPDGRVLVNGGYNAGTAHASAEIFNPSSGTWSSGGSMSSGRLAQEMVVLLNGKVLVAGGASLAPAYSASLDLFDPNVGVWTSAGAMSGVRTAVTTVPLPNGKVLAVGGQSGAVVKDVAELYDPALNSWSLANPMATPRMSPGSALLSDGRVLMAAGQDQTGPDTVTSKSEIYDPVSGNWTPTGDMGAARYNFPMVLLPNDKVLAAGGANITDSFSASELYDPAAGTWSPTGGMSVKRYRHSLTILPDGKVLAVGGRNTASLSSCELYDPVTGTWTVTGSMATPRYDHTATLLFNGKVLVTGGYQTPATYLQSAELYDPAAGTWSAAAALGVTRIAHTAALLPSGKVLVSGGYNAGQTHPTSAVYDPVKNAWAVGPTLLAARNGQSMVALPDGGVLLVGGSDFVGPLASAEKAFFSEYDQRLVPAFRPVIASVNGSSSYPVVVSTTGRNTVYGSTFTGRSWQGVEPPRVTLRAMQAGDWGATLASPRVVDLSSTVFEASWSSGDLSFRIPAGVPPGYYQLRVHAGAFLSDAKLVRLPAVDFSGGTVAAAGFTDVSSGSLVVRWGATVRSGTEFLVQLSTAADFGALQASTGSYDSRVSFAGLQSQTTYYARLALTAGGPYAPLGSTCTLPVPPSQAGTPTAAVLGISSISWTWSLLPGATGYEVFQASSGILLANVAAPPYIQQGLLPNATYGFVLRGCNVSGAGPLSPSATAWTLAAPPTGIAATLFITSAALHWSWNSNPAWTLAQLERSTDSAVYSERLSAAATTHLDTGLQACSTYQYRVRYRNIAGEATATDALQFVTAGSTPLAPGSLSAESLSGRRIGLLWEPASSGDAVEYRLYWDNGTGTVDYGSPFAVLSSTVTSFTTGALVDGTVYRFGLRAYNRCALEDSNTRVAAQAVAMESLTGVKAAIKVPQSGKRIKGNRVTVMAELTLGSEGQTKQVLFQYRAAGGVAWTDIVAANANHPNPDLEAPYFVHWDVTGLAAGDYELRAQATDVYSAVDAAPAIITISVTNAPVDFDISETSQGGGKVKKEQVVYQSVANTVQAADEGSAQTTKVLIPADALSASTVAVAVTNNPSALPILPTGIESAGASVEITLSNGQSQLSSGKTATVTLSYKDDNDDGIVDGTSCRADRLVVYAHDTAGGEWRKEGAASVDRTAKTVSAPTPHFSFFALVVPTSSDLSALRIYPSPFRPNNDSTDDGVPYDPSNANSGIIFENLPNSSKIRVYTVTGQLVAHFDAGTSGKVQWDASNDEGGQVASGVYLAVVSAPGQKEVVRKIAIIR